MALPHTMTRAERDNMVCAMAGALIKYDAFRDPNDAIRCLMAKGYSPFLVLRFADDAMQVAQQEAIVAREMSQT